MMLLRINRPLQDVRNKKYKSFSLSIPNQMLLILLHISPTKTPRTFFFNIQIAVNPLFTLGCRKPIFLLNLLLGWFLNIWRRCTNCWILALWRLLKTSSPGCDFTRSCSGSTVPIALTKDSSCSLHPHGQAKSGLWWGITVGWTNNVSTATTWILLRPGPEGPSEHGVLKETSIRLQLGGSKTNLQQRACPVFPPGVQPPGREVPSSSILGQLMPSWWLSVGIAISSLRLSAHTIELLPWTRQDTWLVGYIPEHQWSSPGEPWSVPRSSYHGPPQLSA